MVVQGFSLARRFGSVDALHDVSLEVGPGVLGLLGVNGAGKTTLLRLLATTIRPSAGSLLHFGAPAPGRLAAVRKRIGYMPQELPLPVALRVRDFLEYMAWLRAVPRSERRAEVGIAAELADLGPRLDDRLGSLSGGMRRRVLLAQALVGSPDLLLLDEPTAGLDPEQRIRVRELIQRTRADGRAIVVSSHLMEDVADVADRVLMLDAGLTVFDGTLEELRRRGEGLVTPRSGLSPYEAAFLSLRRGAR